MSINSNPLFTFNAENSAAKFGPPAFVHGDDLFHGLHRERLMDGQGVREDDLVPDHDSAGEPAFVPQSGPIEDERVRGDGEPRRRFRVSNSAGEQHFVVALHPNANEFRRILDVKSKEIG